MILVTGGAGYIGSIIVEELLKQRYEVVVVDNLQQGHKQAVLPGAKLVEANYGDIKAMDKVFSRYKIDSVMHLAADSIIPLSMDDPQKPFVNNVVNGINFLNSMLRARTKKIIFSSSAAVYGQPHEIPIMEDHPHMPVNPLGETKLIFERILYWYGIAYGLKHISLRYFNAAGASEKLGEAHHPETHLIPNILKAAVDRNHPINIYGDDYPTKDGSCIRDYVHVIDIARAHIQALERIDRLSGRAYNLGTGSGYTVIEVVNAAQKVCGFEIPMAISSRREGDLSVLTASPNKAKIDLDWKPEHPDLETVIGSSWKWLKAHPHGYAF